MALVLVRPRLEIVDALTRRGFLAGGLGIGAAVVGCGAEEQSGGEAAGGLGSEVTIAHQFGTTRIESEPQRVASVGFLRS